MDQVLSQWAIPPKMDSGMSTSELNSLSSQHIALACMCSTVLQLQFNVTTDIIH